MTRKRKLFGDLRFYLSTLLLALPVIGQNLVENLVNLIDNFMVAGLGDIKMSGASVAGHIVFIFMVLLNAVCMSAGIFVTQYYGADDRRGIRQAVSFKVIIALGLMILFLLVCLVIPGYVLNLMLIGNSQAALIIEEGTRYMRIISLAGIPMVICYVCSSSLKETGHVRQPLYVSFIAALINMVFNYALIYGNLGCPKLEVAGAAIATVIARTCEAAIFLYIIARSDAPVRIGTSDLFNIDREIFKNIFKRSVRIIASETIWVMTETVTTALYNGKGGADVVSGMASSFTIANLYFTSLGGVNIATSVIIGKLLGEGKLEEAREKKTWIFSGAFIFSAFVTLLAIATTLLVPVIYANLSISAQSICERMVFYMALFMPAWILLNVELAVARSGGDADMAFYLDGIVNVVIMIPLVFFLAKGTAIGPVGIYIISKFVDVAKVVACHFYLKKETWLVNLTV
ncbi:MAG: MATE family efflux transporter [Erysipelotrichaceae bacterium]|nr:MATE family efflux transporter [Erysipelotrichaceae bacterium]